MLALAFLCAAALPVAVLAPAAAYAGQWIQVSCANPDQSPAPSEGWTSYAGGGTGFGSTSSPNCAPGNPMFALLSSDFTAPVGAGETLQYTPPPGSTLVGGNIDVSLTADGYGQDASATTVLYTPTPNYDAGDVFYQCANGQPPCPADQFSGVLALPADRGGDLYLSAGCGGSPGQSCNQGANNGAWSLVQLWWAKLLLNNTSVPAASGFSGPLLSPNAHGTADLAFTATDPNGPGVYTVAVDIDGQPAYDATPNTNQGNCDPVATGATTGALMFDTQQPCPQTETIDIPVDTTTLTDGQHDLKVTVTDAAQNTSTVLDQTITTLNHPTPAPPTPPAATAPPVYSIALNPATRRLTHGVRRRYTRSTLKLSGTLDNASGVAAPNVPVTLWAKAATGGHFVELAGTTTDGTGAWTLAAPRGHSRLLTIVTGANIQPATAMGSINLRETVTPVLSLHVTTPGHGRIIFTGRLAIAPLGTPRPLVFIQTNGPNGWEVVGSPIRVDRHGTFRYTYRSSPLTLDRRFSFRATTPRTSLWEPAQSTTRSAVVH